MLLSTKKPQTHPRLRIPIIHFTLHKNSDVVLPLLREDVVGDGDHLDAAYLEAGLLEGLARGTFEEGLAVLEMAARKLPRSYGTALSAHAGRSPGYNAHNLNIPAPWLPDLLPHTTFPCALVMMAATPTRGLGGEVLLVVVAML